jgi:uncharacterized Zn-binding protein involved in type VI secretion
MGGLLIARLGDPATHPGHICTSAQKTVAEGILVARIGDIYCCDIHGPNPIVEGCVITTVEGKLCAHHTSLCACGARIIATAVRTYAE